MSNKDTAVAKVAEEVQVTTLESALPAIVDENIVDIAAHAEERLAALDKIKKVALKLTNPNDWVDENGKPYLQGSGAEKVARLFGVSWRIFEPAEEDIGQGHYIITYKGEFALGGAIITAIGTRSSKDGFFKKYKYAGDERIELPPSEIDKGDVKKAAYTNLIANGITRLLGIRNLTYEDLEQYAGIKRNQVSTVEYKKAGKAQSSQGGRAPSSSQEKKETKPPGNGDEPATLAQAQAIHSILKDKGVVDELTKMQKVAKILGLKEVPTAIAKLTKSQASTVIEALQKEQKEAAGGEE